jgi:hypothetical protein
MRGTSDLRSAPAIPRHNGPKKSPVRCLELPLLAGVGREINPTPDCVTRLAIAVHKRDEQSDVVVEGGRTRGSRAAVTAANLLGVGLFVIGLIMTALEFFGPPFGISWGPRPPLAWVCDGFWFVVTIAGGALMFPKGKGTNVA